MKSQSIVYLLYGSEHIYWILDFQSKVHSIWDLWISDLQKCKDNDFLKWGGQAEVFGQVQRKSGFRSGAASARIYLPRKVRGGFNVPRLQVAQASFRVQTDGVCCYVLRSGTCSWAVVELARGAPFERRINIDLFI